MKLQELDNDLKMMIGDIVLCSGMIAYLGVFNLQARINCVNHWRSMLENLEINYNKQCSLSVIGVGVEWWWI